LSDKNHWTPAAAPSLPISRKKTYELVAERS